MLGSAGSHAQGRTRCVWLLLLLLTLGGLPVSAHDAPSHPPECAAAALDCRWECISGRSDPGCYTVATLVRPAATVQGITLVTQTTHEKVGYLTRALAAWNGPASIAFYAYTSDELAFFMNYTCSSCTIAVVYGGLRKQAYPINLLRNVALKDAQTSLAFVFDTDFMPSSQLHDLLVAHVAAASSAKRMAWVIPAFEVKRSSLVDMPANFSALRAAFKGGDVGVFHDGRGGHRNTQNSRWLNSSEQYCLKDTKPNYEPYLLINKDEPDFPFFDTKFVDRGMNKVMWAQELKALGYQFCVVPRAWIVHVFEKRPKYRPFYAHGVYNGRHKVQLRLKQDEQSGSSISLLSPDTPRAAADAVVQAPPDVTQRRSQRHRRASRNNSGKRHGGAHPSKQPPVQPTDDLLRPTDKPLPTKT